MRDEVVISCLNGDAFFCCLFHESPTSRQSRQVSSQSVHSRVSLHVLFLMALFTPEFDFMFCFSWLPQASNQNRLIKVDQLQRVTRWWFQTFLIFTPYLGKIPILTNIFQRG